MAKAIRAFQYCYRCGVENPPEGFCSNGYCRPCMNAYAKAWRVKTPERHEIVKANHRKFYQRHRERALGNAVLAGRKLKVEIIKAYGGKCKCCGEKRIEFLAMDHINGGGVAHRKSIHGGGAGHKMYAWLKRNGCPKEFRILCHNCNMALGMLGYCPHKSDNSYLDITIRKRQVHKNSVKPVKA